MKTYKLYNPIVFILFLFVSYQVQAQSRKLNKILENPEDRIYLMQQISSDQKMATEMIDYLSNNTEATAQLKVKFCKQKEIMTNKTKMEMCPMCKKKTDLKKKRRKKTTIR